VSIDSDDEFGRLAAHKQLFEAIHNAEANDQNLFFAQIDALKGTNFGKSYFSLSIFLNSESMLRRSWWMGYWMT
jgi:hypothetical protein